jgi:DNA-binding NarL/FixJ family response regulator
MSSHSSPLNASKRHKVLIVDDHPIFRRGLAELISLEPDLEVCGEAADIAEALLLVDSARPDAAIIDLSLKSGLAIELIQQIKARNKNVKMLVSSIHDELLFAERSLRAGALGYLPKDEPIEKLVEALHRILRGEIYLSPRMANRMIHHLVGQPAEEDPIKTLSNRELEVFEMIGRGMTTRNIARKLKLSAKTVETHREKIKGKLNLKNSAELNRRAVQWVLENV